MTEVVQSSEDDLQALLDGESLESYAARHHATEWIVTRGARGTTLISGAGRSELATEPVRGGKRVGLGDRFLAHYLFGRATGQPPDDSARAACEACRPELTGEPS